MAQSSREIYWSALLADFRCSGLTHVEFEHFRESRRCPTPANAEFYLIGRLPPSSLFGKVSRRHPVKLHYPWAYCA